MTPNIDDIRRDDELLDSLGARSAPQHSDATTDALASWVREIDAPDRPVPAGRYARRRARRGPARVGVVVAATITALSISGVAAAVGGVPVITKVVHQMGFAHRGADFGSGAAGPQSTNAPVSTAAPTDPSSSYATDESSESVSSTGSTASTQGPTLDPSTTASSVAAHRFLPGVLDTARHRATPGHPPASRWTPPPVRTSAPPSSTGQSSSSQYPSSTSTSSSTPSDSSSSSSTPSSRPSSSTGPSASTTAPGSTTRPPEPTHPPKPTRTPKPSATSSTSDSTPPTLSSTSTQPSDSSSSSTSGSRSSNAARSSSSSH